MRTFFARLWYSSRPLTGIGSNTRRPAHLPGRLADVRASVGSQDGFLLIEVLISTLLVGLMVIATYNGLDSINRSTAEQRRHDQAAELAIESQEQLRSDSASTLLSLPATGHAYTMTVGGTQYTITQKASYGNGGTQTGCSATEKGSTGKGTYILISSTVTWPHSKSIPLTESSIITPPTGSALKVDVTNGGATPTGGVPIAVTYTPVESETPTTIEATTNSSGCALFAGIPATAATIEAKETQGIVTKWGALHLPPVEVTLVPNVLTEETLALAPGGRIEAEFHYRGSNSYKHPPNGSGAEIPESVTGDTFVAFNKNMKQAPYFETGSNQGSIFKMSGELYEVLPDTAGGAYEAQSTTPQEAIKYPKGNLFPFAGSENSWTVYAGDCTYNDPTTVTEAAKTTVVNPEPPLEVIAAGKATIPVPMTYVLLNVYGEKTQAKIAEAGGTAWKYLETTHSYPVTLTNTKCAGVAPDNETAIKAQHTQQTTTGSIWGGHLEVPFQPFGEYDLCLYDGGKTYTVKPYTNTSTTTPVTRNIYLAEVSNKEKEAARKAAETATKNARIATEATEKTTWEAEVRTNGKSASTKEREDLEKGSAQETKRRSAETTEKNNETAAITAETKEISEKEVTVESGKTSC